jgi:hypothetical protein
VKFEVLLAVSIIYQVVILLLVRRWIVNREKHLKSLAKPQGSSSPDRHSPVILEHTRLRRKATIVWAAVLIGFCFMTILSNWDGIGALPWSLVILGVVLILAFTWVPWALVVHTYGVAFLLDDEAITRIFPWSKRQSVRWGEIESVSYSWAWTWFTISIGKGTMHVPTVISNLDRFTKSMVDSIPRERIRVSDEILAKALLGSFRH